MVAGQLHKTRDLNYKKKKMSEKLIILISSIKIRKYDITRFEIDDLELKFDNIVEIHELIEYVHPGFSSMFTNRYEDKRIKNFFNLQDWKNRILLLKKKFGKNILIYNLVRVNDFKSLKINYFLKRNRFKIIAYSSNSYPFYNKKNILKKLFAIIENSSFSLKKVQIFMEQKISIWIAQKLKLYSDFIISTGNNNIKELKANRYTKILFGHSYDFNMYLKYKNTKYSRDGNYGLFLEAPTPLYNLGDDFINDKNEFNGTPNKWLKSLNKFFDFIESELNIKILIAPHPKIKHLEKFSKHYNGREVLDYNLYQAAKKSKIMISRDSSGFSYAAIYKIPAIFIYTEELKKKIKTL